MWYVPGQLALVMGYHCNSTLWIVPVALPFFGSYLKWSQKTWDHIRNRTLLNNVPLHDRSTRPSSILCTLIKFHCKKAINQGNSYPAPQSTLRQCTCTWNRSALYPQLFCATFYSHIMLMMMKDFHQQIETWTARQFNSMLARACKSRIFVAIIIEPLLYQYVLLDVKLDNWLAVESETAFIYTMLNLHCYIATGKEEPLITSAALILHL